MGISQCVSESRPVYKGKDGNAECVVLSSGSFDPEGLDTFVIYAFQGGGGRLSCCPAEDFDKSFEQIE